MSRSLVFSSVPLWAKQHMVTLDIVLSELASGNDMFLLSCRGSLLRCLANPTHEQELCGRCIAQTDHSVSSLVPPEVTHIWLTGVELPIDVSSRLVFSSMDEALGFEVDGANLGQYITNALVGEERDLLRTLSESHRDRLAVMARNAAMLFLEGKQILADYAIDEVLVRNPRRDSEGPLVAAAQSLGLRVGAFDARGSGGSVKVALFKGADRLYVPDAWRARVEAVPVPELASSSEVAVLGREYLEFNAAGEVHPDVGVPVFPTHGDFFHEMRRPETKLVAVFTSSEWEFFGSPDRLIDGRWITQYDYLERIVTDLVLTERHDIVIRWHPNLATAGPQELMQLQRIVEVSNNQVVHILPNDYSSSRRLIEEADVVVTFGSTIAADAVWSGKPVIQCSSTWLDASGCVTVVNSFEELTHLLDSKVAVANPATALRLAYLLREADLPVPRYFQMHEGRWRLLETQKDLKPMQSEANTRWRALLKYFRERLST